MFGVGKVTVLVNDLDASIRFYTETLGFPLLHRLSNRWAEIDGPGIIIGLRPRPAAVLAFESHLLIGFWVDDLEDARRCLEARGLSFEGEIVHFETVRLLFFTDPDWTPLYLCQTTTDIYQLAD